jgi:hypothetical protein
MENVLAFGTRSWAITRDADLRRLEPGTRKRWKAYHGQICIAFTATKTAANPSSPTPSFSKG